MTERRAAYRTRKATKREPSELEEELEQQLALLQFPAHVREHMFHPVRRWRFDFAWPALMLAVEVEGATWAGGRHTRGSGFAKDCIKYNEAALLGWTVLRFTGAMVKDGQAVAYIEQGIKNARQNL